MRPQVGPVVSRWIVRLSCVAAIWAVVVVPMILLGMGPRPGLLAVIAAGVAATVFCAVDVLAASEPVRWLRPVPIPPRPLEDPRANQLLRMVEAAADDPNRATALRTTLAGLAAGVTGADVGVDGADVGEDGRPLPLAEIDRIVRSIESHGHH